MCLMNHGQISMALKEVSRLLCRTRTLPRAENKADACLDANPTPFDKAQNLVQRFLQKLPGVLIGSGLA